MSRVSLDIEEAREETIRDFKKLQEDILLHEHDIIMENLKRKQRGEYRVATQMDIKKRLLPDGSLDIITLPSTELLLKIFRVFDKHGLIRNDLCFDPEHFMETVVREHWNDYE